MALHLARGVATAALVFPFLDKAQRVNRIRRWSARLLRILAIHLEISGTPPIGATAPVMIVANHVSWLDIYAINTVRAARFIAKSEVRRWPVIGWLCGQAGTFFVERARKRHTAQINEQVAAALMQGDTVAVFPEGTTTAGDVVLPFHASLLQPALKCDALLYPVAIRYTRADGSLCSEADYAGDKSIAGSLRLMATQPVIRARLQFLPPLTCVGRPRHELAREAARLIAGALGLEFRDWRAAPRDACQGPPRSSSGLRLWLRKPPEANSRSPT